SPVSRHGKADNYPRRRPRRLTEPLNESATGDLPDSSELPGAWPWGILSAPALSGQPGLPQQAPSPLSPVLFFTVRWLLPPGEQALKGGKDAVVRELAALGPMPAAQKRLLTVALALLAAWASEGKLHHFDTTSTTYAGLVVLLLPRIGVMNWKDIQKHIPWGTLIVFGVGISLGAALVSTQAGHWLAQEVVRNTGLERLGTLGGF